MTDCYKNLIIKELDIILNQEVFNKNTNYIFKVKAYQKVIQQLKTLSGNDKITCIDDLNIIDGIGKKIKLKIEEILETGKLSSSRNENYSEIKLFNELLKIHGVGPAKAKELINNGIISIQDLIDKNARLHLLNNIQTIGLKYYNDINLSIPRKEIDKHNVFLTNELSTIDKDIKIVIVGSYRRELYQSSDIDVLVTLNRNIDIIAKNNLLLKIIYKLKELNYVKETLTIGDKKFMGIVKLKYQRHFRRLDILITSQKEFPFAILYFTGSANLNIILRKNAIKKNLRLNEYSLIDIKTNKEFSADIKTEEEIFNILGYSYIPPKYRSQQSIINQHKLNII